MYKRKEIIEDCTLYLGDCLDIMPTLEKVDAVVTDPPYLYLNHKLDRYFNYVEWIEQVFNVTKENASFGFFGRGVSLAQWICEADKMGFKFKEEIVWNKIKTSSPFSSLGRVHELFILFAKGNFKLNKVYINHIEDRFNVEDFKNISNSLKKICSKLRQLKSIDELQELLKGGYTKDHKPKHSITGSKFKGNDSAYSVIKQIELGAVLKTIINKFPENYSYQHPTQKPVELMENIIKLTTNNQNVVLDSFMGSGTTLVACAKMGRKGIGIEIDEEYFDIACKRVEEAYKQQDMFGY